MPLQHLGGHRIDVHLDVGVRHVDPDHLWVGAGHSLYRDAVVLLLVENLDAKRDAVCRVFEVGRVIQQDGSVANKVAGRAKRAADKTRKPTEHLILGAEHRQTLGAPRIDHLIHGGERVLGRSSRRRLTLGKLADQAQRPVDLVPGSGAHSDSLRRRLTGSCSPGVYLTQPFFSSCSASSSAIATLVPCTGCFR